MTDKADIRNIPSRASGAAVKTTLGIAVEALEKSAAGGCSSPQLCHDESVRCCRCRARDALAAMHSAPQLLHDLNAVARVVNECVPSVILDDKKKLLFVTQIVMKVMLSTELYQRWKAGLGCKRCGDVKLDWQVYCGAACSQLAEIEMKDYRHSMAELERLMELSPAAGSPDGDRLRELAEKVEMFELAHFPLPEPTPEEAAIFRAEQERGPKPDGVD